jgi:predicted outer membrane repeat protein
MGSDISIDEHGNVFSTGSFNGTADFDPSPATYSLTSAGYWDNYVIKLDTDGNFIWAKAMGGTLTDNSYGLALDTSGSVYTTGGFANTVDFDPGPGTYNVTSAASVDIFISKLDTNGNFVWVKHMPGTYVQYGMNLVLDETGNIYTIGDNLGTADFDPGAGTYNLSTSGYNDIFVSKLTATPQIYYVKWDATGANNGMSWTDAYTDLQSALSVASSGDEIWVAAGTYKPTTGTDRTISFDLRNGVAVYGGFAGTETLRSQRNFEMNGTVLSGDIGVEGGNSDNSYHVVSSEATNDATLLNGFSVTAGNANGSPPYDNGGGIFIKNSSLKLQNMVFQGNVASMNGGGLYSIGSDSTLMNITFWGNSVNNSGGGIYNSQSDLSLFNITFDGNSAGYSGGGMSNLSSDPTLTNVTFHNNSATTYGGGLAQSFSNPTLINVTFSGNSASASGGGGITNDASNPVIINSILYGNVGGEIRNFTGSAPQVSYSIVQGGYAGTGNMNVNPLLQALWDNGGFTQTMAIRSDSPAINAGTNTGCPATDQRGVTRPQGSHCDIGAYEVKGSIAISIAGTEIESYSLTPSESMRVRFGGVNNGPVKIMNTDNVSIMAAERLIYKADNIATSFTEMMGLPDSQLDTTYWLPWYNNTGLDTQLRFANVSNATASVHVYIGGDEMFGSPFTLLAGESLKKSFPGIDDGPVKIESNQDIVAAARLIYKAAGGSNTSFSEIMALPASQLDNTYWLPWYNNTGLDTQLRFANVTDQTASVHIYIGGDEMIGSPFTLDPGESTRKSFSGIDDGPVKIESDQDIVVAERLIYKANGLPTSFTEMMALPDKSLDTTYWLPWYNNIGLDTQLRFANVTDQTATVHVYIGGDEMDGSPFTLPVDGSMRISFQGIDDGPVQIVSDQNIVVAERLIYKVDNIPASFSEMMALPNSQLDSTYWFPWYNNLGLDTQLRFGVP